ncbi:glycosyltransferase [Microbacterium xanthum]|uniref:glycosyltransferase n=1 Tax=Microbacterium xanthum TaxID=3079794 RepID=UPI002AD283F3|nr:glycosyltransferase [Microbacterium sp. KSW-48]MDZ8172497.1 glycosyltransferase [Microbacterium sp. KSW-48]
MRVLLVTAGSRGDIEPFLALARRLGADGHDAVVALPDRSGAVTDGVATISLGADFTRVIEQQGVSPIRAMRSLRSVIRPIMRAVLVGTARAIADTSPDVVVYHPKALSAPMAADASRIPHVVAELVPAMTPTRALPAAGTVPFDIGPLNRATYAAATAGRRMFSAEMDAAATALGLSERPRLDSPAASNLVPVSSTLLSRPADWPATTTLTGAWVDKPEGAPDLDLDLEEFLRLGDVLYAGFGSMASPGAARRGRAVVQAARSNGMRVLMATGLGGLEIDGDLAGSDVLTRTSVDHRSVLPRVTAAIHHGGVGTVHAAVGAGVPSVVVPFIADQPFWGARLADAGLAAAPIRASRLTAERLARALADVDRLRPATIAASQRMRGEDGTGTAVRILEQVTRRRV